jgi:nitroreductase
MDYNGLLELFKKRQSIRKFKPDPVPDEYVDKIIEAARWAPSGANSQPWQFIVIKKDELKKRISEIIEENQDTVVKIELTRDEDIRFNFRPLGFGSAPVFIIQVGDPRLKECYPLETGLTHGDRTLESSQASAFLYMMLAATSLGLAAQWVSASSATYPQALIKKLLGVPRELVIYDMMALGYPDMTPPPRLVRSKKDIVHYDGYDKSKYATDQQIREYIIKIRKGAPI